jgi:hypothetical protein
VQNEFSARYIHINVTNNADNPKKYVIKLASIPHVVTKWWVTFWGVEIIFGLGKLYSNFVEPKD